MKRTPKTPKHNAEMVLDAAKLSAPEARHLVSSYYASQEMRKRLDLQIRHIGTKAGIVEEGGNPVLPPLLNFVGNSSAEIEKTMAAGLQRFAEASPIGRWCLSHHGVGPVISAGLLAHLDITKAPSASHFWSFAGLNPQMKWERSEKRPYNAELKQLCYHLGECFKRTSNHPESHYGKIYRERKALVVERNEAGHNAERAKTFTTNSAAVRKLLKAGKLPAGNLDRQAANYAAKIFLAHLHAVMQFEKYRRVAMPYAIEHLGHVDLIEVPNGEMFPGFLDAYHGAKKAA
jgi:hypothetical protein